MATTRAQQASWLLLLINIAAVNAQTSTPFWTYTSRFVESISLSQYTFMAGDTTTYSDTSTRTVKSGVTPTVTAFSTSTYDSLYGYDDLQVVYAYYTDGAVPESDLEPTFDYSDYSRTRYQTTSTTDSLQTVIKMPVTYTAPASCPTSFTYSTDEIVSVPTQVIDQVTPTSKSTGSPYTYSYLTYAISTTETWFLSPGAAPFHTSTAYNYKYSIASCEVPTAYPTLSGGYGGGGYTSGGSDDDIGICSWYSGCTSLKVWVIIIASIIPTLFILGFIENYFWFRRLMLGKGALRFGTISWICISLWVACFTRTQSRRSPEDQKLLRQKWNNTKASDAFKLWWRWGFRHAYPVPLLGQYSRNTVGIVPAGQPLPQMGQTVTYGPGFQPPPGAPGAVYPNGVAPNGQPYYPPPQGWVPASNGQTYPVPPPGQAYMLPPNGNVNYYGEQPKEAANITERTVSPPLPENTQNAPYEVPSPPTSTVPSPPPAHAGVNGNVAEAPSPVSTVQPTELPVMSGAQPAAPPPQGPLPPRPT
jgi:hypothetical protein